MRRDDALKRWDKKTNGRVYGKTTVPQDNAKSTRFFYEPDQIWTRSHTSVAKKQGPLGLRPKTRTECCVLKST